jgi:hypothetical protein
MAVCAECGARQLTRGVFAQKAQELLAASLSSSAKGGNPKVGLMRQVALYRAG